MAAKKTKSGAGEEQKAAAVGSAPQTARCRIQAGMVMMALAVFLGCFYYSPFDVGLVSAVSATLGVTGAACVMWGAQDEWCGRGRIAFAAALFGAYAVYFLVACVFAKVPYYALTFAPIGLAMPLVAAMVAVAGRGAAAHVAVFVDTVLVLLSGLGVWAIVQFFAFPELFAHTATHPLPSANTFAALLNAGLVLGLGRFFMARDAGRRGIAAGYAACVLALGGGVIATGSSGALVSLMCVLPVFFVLGGMTGLVRFLPCVGFGLIFYAAFIFMNDVAQGQVSSLYHGTFHGRSYNERWLIWEAALRLYAAHPLFGVGPGGFSAFYPPLRLAGDESSGLHAHNDLLHMAGEMGLAGVGLYVLAAIYVGWRCVRRMIDVRGLVRGGDRAATREGMMMAAVAGAAGAIFVQGAVETVLISVAGALMMGALAGCLGAMAGGGALCVRPAREAGRGTGREAWAAGGLVAAVVAFAFVALWPLKVPSLLAQAQGDLLRGEAAAFDARIQQADRHAFGLAPGVYVMSAQWPMAALLSGTDLPPDQVALLRGRVEALFDRALSLDPTMAAVWAQRGEIAAAAGDEARAMEMWRSALVLDPGYLPARLSLANAVRKAGAEDAYAVIMTDGADIPYWRFAPEGYYAKLLGLLEDGRNPQMQERVREYLKNAEKNRARSVGISGLLRGN